MEQQSGMFSPGRDHQKKLRKQKDDLQKKIDDFNEGGYKDASRDHIDSSLRTFPIYTKWPEQPPEPNDDCIFEKRFMSGYGIYIDYQPPKGWFRNYRDLNNIENGILWMRIVTVRYHTDKDSIESMSIVNRSDICEAPY